MPGAGARQNVSAYALVPGNNVSRVGISSARVGAMMLIQSVVGTGAAQNFSKFMDREPELEPFGQY